jgi:hypothetical protein
MAAIMTITPPRCGLRTALARWAQPSHNLLWLRSHFKNAWRGATRTCLPTAAPPCAKSGSLPQTRSLSPEPGTPEPGPSSNHAPPLCHGRLVLALGGQWRPLAPPRTKGGGGLVPQNRKAVPNQAKPREKAPFVLEGEPRRPRTAACLGPNYAASCGASFGPKRAF